MPSFLVGTGIWGGKGQGKTFQCTLAYKKLGINPVVMSAGELESGNAGEPAKLIRQRYREASDIIKKVTQTPPFPFSLLSYTFCCSYGRFAEPDIPSKLNTFSALCHISKLPLLTCRPLFQFAIKVCKTWRNNTTCKSWTWAAFDDACQHVLTTV